MKPSAMTAALAGSILTLALASPGAQAAKLRVLYSFDGVANDGLDPQGPLYRDAAGNLFGTTVYGGTYDKGTIFKLARDGSESILHDFTDTPDGGLPWAGVLADGYGDLFMTTREGGPSGAGTIVKLAADGTESVLYAFLGGSDGEQPLTSLIADKSGNMYGATTAGGDDNCIAGGCGTVFRVAPEGTETVLHSFSGADGIYPVAPVARDIAGNLYGTTLNGGAQGYGVVFKLAPDGTETTLYSFAGGSDGANPVGGLTFDAGGNLYGTTAYGGGSVACDSGCGTIFKIAPDGTESVLHAFSGADGSYPEGVLISGLHRDLYGVTAYGGGGTKCDGGCGTVFQITLQGALHVVHAFRGRDGKNPVSQLLMDRKGTLFGSTYFGGAQGQGDIFEIRR